MVDPERAYLADLVRRQRQSWPAGLPTEPTYPLGERPLGEYLRHWAREHPDRPAIVFYGTELTYAQLDELVDRFAGHLAAVGVGVGDRVAVMLPNCPQFVVAFHAVLRIGAVHVPVSPMARDQELAHELVGTGAVVLVTSHALLPMVERVRGRTALRQVVATDPAHYVPAEPTIPVPGGLAAPPGAAAGTVSWPDALAAERAAGLPAVDVGDLAALNFTGGTTGLPKGCEHTQRHMLYTAACLTSMWELGAGERAATSLVFLPMFWIAGEVLAAILPVFTGGTCVLLARWSAEATLAAVARYRVAVLAGTVDSYVELMDHPRIGDHDLSSLRLPVAASFVRKLGVEYRRRWSSLVGGHSLLREAAYGMTETHTFDTFVTGLSDGDRDLRSRPVFCGLPMPGTEFKIVDFVSGELVPLDAEGEICVRSPSVLTRYWGDPADAPALRDGWLHTGDIGLIDAGGFLHFLGRRKEMLKVNGMSVFPAEVEAMLGMHPDIAASGVVGIPDPARGEAPVAFVELRPEARARLDEPALTAWCREQMAAYKVPEIRIVETLPRTATGKVRKNLLAGT